PAQHVSVAVLCNVSNGQPTDAAHALADLFLPAPREQSEPAPRSLTTAEIAAVTGLYRHAATGRAVRFLSDSGGLHLEDGPTLVPLSATRFQLGEDTVEIDTRGTITVSDSHGAIDQLERVAPASPDAQALQALAGRY